MLSNRPAPTTVAVAENEDGVNVSDASAASRGVKRDRMGQLLASSASDGTGVGSSSSTNQQDDRSKAALVDSAKARYLARKQQK
jgi:hypothetical protein